MTTTLLDRTTLLSPTTPPALDADELSALLNPLAEDPALWRLLAQFSADETRWWRRLHHSDQVDIWLLTWLTGHSTDLHDHGGSAGAFAVVDGSLTEVRIAPDERDVVRTTIHAGQGAGVTPSTVHDVYNAAAAPAISLHAYSPPLKEMTFYTLENVGLTAVRTTATHEASLDAA